MRPRTPPACVPWTSHRRPLEGRNARALADTRPTPASHTRPHHRARRSRPRKQQDCVSPPPSPPPQSTRRAGRTIAAGQVQPGTRPRSRCKCPARPSRTRRRGAGAPRPPPARAADGPRVRGARRTGPPQRTPPASTVRGVEKRSRLPTPESACAGPHRVGRPRGRPFPAGSRGAHPMRFWEGGSGPHPSLYISRARVYRTPRAGCPRGHPGAPSQTGRILAGPPPSLTKKIRQCRATPGWRDTPPAFLLFSKSEPGGEGLPYAQDRMSAWAMRGGVLRAGGWGEPGALSAGKNTAVNMDAVVARYSRLFRGAGGPNGAR